MAAYTVRLFVVTIPSVDTFISDLAGFYSSGAKVSPTFTAWRSQDAVFRRDPGHIIGLFDFTYRVYLDARRTSIPFPECCSTTS